MAYALIFIGTLLIAIAATLGSIRLGRVKIFRDHPDQVRKLHKNPTPNTGGIAIVFSFAVGATVSLFIFSESLSEAFLGFLPFLIGSATLVFIAGIYDDIKGLDSVAKFSVQILAGCLLLAGLDLNYVSAHVAFMEYPYVVRVAFYSLCLLWLVACSNTVNLVDGIDGLAGTLSVLSLLGVAVISVNWNVAATFMLALPLIAAILGFLIFNRPPARLFMGDSGSLFIGFLIGACTLVLSVHAQHWMYTLALVLFMAMPLMDTVFSIIRRLKLRISPFESDNNHIHHILQRYFEGPGLAVLTISAAATLLGVIAVLLMNTQNTVLFFSVYGLLFFLFVVIAVVYTAKLDKKTSLFLYRPESDDSDPVELPSRPSLRSVFGDSEVIDADKSHRKTGSKN